MKKLLYVMCLIVAVSAANAGLVAQWSMEEGTGAATLDAVSGSADAIDGAAWTAGAAAGSTAAIDFSEATNPATYTNFSGVAGAGDRTVTAWVKTSSTGRNGIIAWGSSTAPAGALGKRASFVVEGGKLRFEIGGGFALSSSTVNDGEWHHVAISTSGSDTANTVFWIDGVADTKTFGNANPIDSIADWCTIGGEGQPGAGQTRFAGVIDDLQVYDAALGAEDIDFIRTNIGTPLADSAYSPVPDNGIDGVAIDAQLSWSSPTTYEPTGYDVWFGTEPNELNPNYDMEKIVSKQLVLTADPALHTDITDDMAYGTQYVWWVDAYEPNTLGDIRHDGARWVFTTEFGTPEVTEPIVVSGPLGGTATLTVTHTGGTSFKWFKDGAEYSAGTLTADGDITLAIDPLAITDEADYHCEVYNSVAPEGDPDAAVSAAARLLAERLVGWWKLDGNLTDSVTEEVPGAPTHDGTTIDPPTYLGTGKVGDGLALVGEPNDIVVIADSNDYFNFYPQGFTVSVWAKTEMTSWGRYIGKQTFIDNVSKGFALGNNDAGLAVSSIRGVAELNSYQTLINDNEWHLVTARYNAELGTHRIYIDGVVVNGEYTSAIAATNTASLVLGAIMTDGTSALIGSLDDVKIWSYPISDEEIAEIYTSVTGETICYNKIFEGHIFDVTGPEGEPDCMVDLLDFAELAAAWLSNGLYPAP